MLHLSQIITKREKSHTAKKREDNTPSLITYYLLHDTSAQHKS